MARTRVPHVALLSRAFHVTSSALACLAFASLAEAQTCNVAGADAMIDVSDVSNFNPVGTHDAIALGAWVGNAGSTNIAYSGCPNLHPIFGGNFYRYSVVGGAGRFEQIGQSWLKHASVAANSSQMCTCGGSGAGLRPGCSDLYGSGFQSAQGTLGPRYQVNAFNGDFVVCPPHPSGGNFGRLEFPLADGIATVGGTGAPTRFFAEQHAIVREDATYSNATTPVGTRGWNNATNVEMSMSGTAANWTVALLAPTQRGVAAIQRWRQIDPSVTETMVDVPGEGRFIVASKATNLGGSPAVWRYEYAVFNLNSDRCAGSFAVPLGSGVANAEFHTVAYRGGDGVGGVNVDGSPWSAAPEGSALVWRTTDYAINPNANAIRWSTLSNFRFDSTTPPAASGQVTIGLWKPGSAGTPISVTGAGQVPGCSAPTIATQPAPNAACPTGAASFSVAVGPGPFTYAWQLQTSPGIWQTLGNDPVPLPCGGGASAFAAPFSSPSVVIGIDGCAGVNTYQVRCIVTDPSGCGSTTSQEATYTVCKADFNCTGGLGILDIFDYLNTWLAGSMLADFDGLNGLEQEDVFVFLNAWLAGC